MSTTRIFTRREVEARIAAGDTLVISDNYILRLNNWQNVHPGGRLVVQHMVGRDASDELSISHSLEILKSMHKFRIGRVEGAWDNFIPPIQGGHFRTAPEIDDEDTSTAGSGSESDQSSSSSGEKRSRASSRSSVDSLPVLKQMPLARNPNLGVKKAPQVMKGWKVEAAPGSYAEQAIQEAIDADIATYPSLDVDTQRAITTKFRALHQRVHDEGYYDCHYSGYAKEMVRYTTLFALFLYTLHHGWYFASAVALGFFWQQIMFTGHDAGHRGITHNFVIDSLIGIFIGNFCCGLSIGWWKSSHNVHHFVTNDPVHDPDIQNTPMFTISPAFFTSIKSSYYDGFHFVWDAAGDFFVKHQKYTYYPIMAIARFNLYYLSWWHLMSPRSIRRGTAAWVRPTEVLAIMCYCYLFFYLLLWKTIPTWSDRMTFLFVSHLATLPLQVQITLSHWGTSTSDLGPTESFAQRQLRTTMDVACPEWLDFFHGGLQFQAVHHLFPRMPRHNLRKAQGMVKEFCAETGIKYQILGFVDLNHHVLGKLQQIADQAKLLAACSKHMAEAGVSDFH